jgi:hypothetical protein
MTTPLKPIGKSTEKQILGRPRRRKKNNIRRDVKEVGVNMRNWIEPPGP